ncbi:hypothetical protein [Deinococcus geothermalis]|uniref:hypothetical protein n=1 Tax=Deinococcus geothermalis TaxID=68909 RepID=UPI002355C4FF|nr:hypothetical protein [Deinococcus geothermalis]
MRASVSSLLGTYRDVHPGLPRPAPPLPDLTPLRAAGLPVREDALVEAAFAKLTERRRVLHNMTARGRFSWADVED